MYNLKEHVSKVLNDVCRRSCPTDEAIFPALQLDPRDGRSLFSHFRAFRFPSTGMVNFEVQIRFCQERCEVVRSVTPRGGQQGVVSYGRKKRNSSLPDASTSSMFEDEEPSTTLLLPSEGEDHPVSSSTDVSSPADVPSPDLLPYIHSVPRKARFQPDEAPQQPKPQEIDPESWKKIEESRGGNPFIHLPQWTSSTQQNVTRWRGNAVLMPDHNITGPAQMPSPGEQVPMHHYPHPGQFQHSVQWPPPPEQMNPPVWSPDFRPRPDTLPQQPGPHYMFPPPRLSPSPSGPRWPPWGGPQRVPPPPEPVATPVPAFPNEVPLSLAIMVGDEEPKKVQRNPPKRFPKTPRAPELFRRPASGAPSVAPAPGPCSVGSTVVVTVVSVVLIYTALLGGAWLLYRRHLRRTRKPAAGFTPVTVSAQPEPAPDDVTFRNIYGDFGS
ncbi:hypothetical protein LAZ67_2000067 [Cordylochernes scorpioides]|uniref:ZP domain-containing protein n=1 Tax=Cordylochernes scorpioides TaxID=51811 RepID=A0ABY6K1W0_9ARAC|nr:hypothetical protein LAZ67_2000067 [Cordylochernes scorpioides]